MHPLQENNSPLVEFMAKGLHLVHTYCVCDRMVFVWNPVWESWQMWGKKAPF